MENSHRQPLTPPSEHAAALHHNLQVNHIDINTAFLQGDLEEELYMQQPEGYTESN